MDKEIKEEIKELKEDVAKIKDRMDIRSGRAYGDPLVEMS